MHRALIAAFAFSVAVSGQTAVQTPPPAAPPQGQRVGGPGRGGQPQTPEQIQSARDAEVERQKSTDALWRKASEGFMTMEKVSYKSSEGGMTIPAFVFTPLKPRGAKGHPALVWVHPDIRGHVYEYYYPYVREAVSRGYVVIAPEYRGSFGYGKDHYDAIDYGGKEVEDVISSVEYLKTMSMVDPDRIGIIGWSHGGMISLLAIQRAPKTFKAVAALVPVTNLFQRLAWNGVESRKQAIDPWNRTGGLPNERKAEYKRRSPIYGVDLIEIPVLVHITKNDADVVIEEAMQLIDALRARKPHLAETKIYDNPLGGHLFDRMAPATLLGRGGGARAPARPDPNALESYIPTNTPEQRDSWNRVWTFLDWNLQPYR